MKANLAATMEPPFLVNPFTKLWCSLSMSHILKHSFLEYFKLAKIATMQVPKVLKMKELFQLYFS
jgi:hypothetical protein